MITSKQIRQALAALIKHKANLPLQVYFDKVENAAQSYVRIALKPMRTDEGFGVFLRRLRVTMAIVLTPIEGKIRHSDLYDIADKLDVATCGYIQIGDRYVTMYDTDVRIFDDILTYEFMLTFADEVDDWEGLSNYDLMQELTLKTADYELKA